MKSKNVAFVVAALLAGILSTACSSTPAAAPETKSGLRRENFRVEIDGRKVDLFVLKNNAGNEVCITNYGARVVSWTARDRDGNFDDIVLGFDDPQGYRKSGEPYFGVIAGRYANRIAGGKFSLDGKSYSIPINNEPNALHGGPGGFDKKVWEARQIDGRTLEFRLFSPDGDQGFPGNLDVTVVYSLSDDNALKVTYRATTDKASPVVLTHHSFFNLHGAGNGTINDHVLTINADAYTPIDAVSIPTGEIAPVAGTPFDFRKPTPIGARLGEANAQLKNGSGYDHNWVLSKPTGSYGQAAKVYDPQSGRTLEVFTTEPGMQLYGGNFLNGSDKGKNGKSYEYRSAFCLEAQHFPDSPNRPNFPSTILRPGEVYTQTCTYKIFAGK